MSSLCLQLGCCTRYVKHAYLINNCYPVREGDKGPKSSELSYLTFYANSRPAKLTKVGNYLERKVTRDIWKGRKQWVAKHSLYHDSLSRKEPITRIQTDALLPALGGIATKLWACTASMIDFTFPFRSHSTVTTKSPSISSKLWSRNVTATSTFFQRMWSKSSTWSWTRVTFNWSRLLARRCVLFPHVNLSFAFWSIISN